MLECPNHKGAFDCPPFCALCEGAQYYRPRAYTVTTWADGFGVWHAKANFRYPGLGNTGEAARVAANALRAMRRAIRKEITDRAATWDNPQPLKRVRLSYEVADNETEPGIGRLLSLTIREKGTK